MLLTIKKYFLKFSSFNCVPANEWKMTLNNDIIITAMDRFVWFVLLIVMSHLVTEFTRVTSGNARSTLHHNPVTANDIGVNTTYKNVNTNATTWPEVTTWTIRPSSKALLLPRQQQQQEQQEQQQQQSILELQQ
ncbi:uncharacterized protein LOC119635688 isoform X1 [Glossina fuscipes]|uniref:Uncharacterized protein LOC119635688 isoform X1 n=1 Tax=Glossina fuscipes TaxID=7396 RepID=A0A9C5YW22_9MUSC|nr:uncharacterized protein LOC119635688 isoform X1 [Glossina fuscipes]